MSLMVIPIVFSAFVQTAMDYPKAKTVDVTDNYHGTSVADPYRWLEQPITTPEVKAWADAENKLTFGYLDKIEGRDRLLDEMKRRINFERFDVPQKVGGHYFYSRNDGLQPQDVLFIADKLNSKPRVLIDPNKFSKDGTVALAGFDVSEDGKKIAYGKSNAGSDWTDWYVMDIATGKDLGEHLKWIKFGGVQFDKAGKGCFYTRFPEPKKSGEALTEANVDAMIYYHAFGTPQSKDRLIFQYKEHPDWFISSAVDEFRETLFVYVNDPSNIYSQVSYVDLKDPKWEVRPLYTEADANFVPVLKKGDKVIVYTTKDAPLGNVVEVNLKAKMGWKTLIPESKDTIDTVTVVGNQIFISAMRDARSAVTRYKLTGERIGEVTMPGLGTASGFDGKSADSETFYAYVDFSTPMTIFRYDIKSQKSEIFRQPKLSFDPKKYEAKQIFFNSKDGTRVPMFVVHKKGLKLDGTNPTILYGYGGFGISQRPWFSVSRSIWMDIGGVWALACIRGGNEYGEGWHTAAIKTNRQKAYDDFIAAGERLVSGGYCSNKTLAVEGGSNGGLLVGAVMTQRPDLIGVAIPEVGVMDMLRFNQFTVGKNWEADYGSPQNPEEFKALLRISPYHNLKAGVQYPATLVMTADTDDRVVPAHSFKFAARLQAVQTGPNPTLIRIETSAGHGGGKPILKALEETRDMYAFILQNMGKKIPAKF